MLYNPSYLFTLEHNEIMKVATVTVAHSLGCPNLFGLVKKYTGGIG